MFSALDPEVRVPEIRRNTPFEYDLTAEPQQLVEKCAQPIQVASPGNIEVILIERIPRLPKWIASSLAEEE